MEIIPKSVICTFKNILSCTRKVDKKGLQFRGYWRVNCTTLFLNEIGSVVHQNRNQMKHILKTTFIALLLVCLPAAAQERITKYIPSPNPDRIVLNVNGDPATSMAVTWRSDTTVMETVAQISVNLPTVFLADSAATVTGTYQDVTGSGVTARFHSVSFTGLAPGTAYAYRVGTGRNASEWFIFKTAVKSNDPFTFLFFGDSQIGSKSLFARVIRQAYQSTPDAAILVFAGDLIDGGLGSTPNDEEWGDWHAAACFITGGIPVLAAPGNHEYYDPVVRHNRDLNRYWRAGFTLPENGPSGLEETAYSTDYQGVRFIIINSDEMIKNEVFVRSQTEWVEGLLRDNPCRWTVMVFHHPIYSTAANRDNKVIRENLKPLFDRYGVDLVLTGHDHTYARGMMIPERGTMNRGKVGPVYVVSVSGSKQYKQDADKWWEVGLTNSQLWQRVTIDGNRLIYQAYDAAGNIVDQFMLNRMKDGTKRIGVPSVGKTK